jgi:hypothetical protein
MKAGYPYTAKFFDLKKTCTPEAKIWFNVVLTEVKALLDAAQLEMTTFERKVAFEAYAKNLIEELYEEAAAQWLGVPVDKFRVWATESNKDIQPKGGQS